MENAFEGWREWQNSIGWAKDNGVEITDENMLVVIEYGPKSLW